MTMIGIGVCGGINAEIRNSCESLRTGAPVAVATLGNDAGTVGRALASIGLEFLTIQVRPDPGPDTERHDGDQDRKSN
jgi:hypothetical protein